MGLLIRLSQHRLAGGGENLPRSHVGDLRGHVSVFNGRLPFRDVLHGDSQVAHRAFDGVLLKRSQFHANPRDLLNSLLQEQVCLRDPLWSGDGNIGKAGETALIWKVTGELAGPHIHKGEGFVNMLVAV